MPKSLKPLIVLLFAALFGTRCSTPPKHADAAAPGKSPSSELVIASKVLGSAPPHLDGSPLRINGLFLETAQGRTVLPPQLTSKPLAVSQARRETRATLADGRVVTLSLERQGNHLNLRLHAEPSNDIVKWGFAIEARPDEYFTGLMERVVDGPQQASWAPERTEGLNLRGQKVDMILKPTTSVYAPYYLSSRGYALFVHGNWPGFFDFCASDPTQVKVEFEGPSFEAKIYTAKEPKTLIVDHALDAGPPILPPKWMYTPWRWRDEHVHRTTYYDGTPVTQPFNSEVAEDVLMMRAYGIPCGVYWIDRPWGPGPLGYDDFEIDEKRLPRFAEMVKWLNSDKTQLVLWIGPFFQGKMAQEAFAKGYTLAGQQRPANGNNYPMVDLTNPDAKAYWQSGVAKLLDLGVAGFKLDRAEENIPESGPYRVYDGRSIRENRNAYPAMYLKATYDVSKKHRGDDFVLMPRAAYTGSSPYGVFWGGDIGATHGGLRASIIAAQRAAVMGYPNWGSDTCGYSGKTKLETELSARWLAFSCFTPIMEVGPTRNVAFWNVPREPSYDATAIAAWRLYARLHEKLVDYSYSYAKEANATGVPIIRPLFLTDPRSPDAWTNWWTFLYGRDLLVSPIWKEGQKTQDVYLPAGDKWRDAWNPGKIYDGGKTIQVTAEIHQIPLFVRVGAKVDLGDLNKEYEEAVAIAKNPPDLKTLDAELRLHLEKNAK